MSATGFIALHRGDEADALLANHPTAFLLLLQIAMRARFLETDCPVTGLKAGQAFIGDWKNAGIHSVMAYRHAKKILVRFKFATFKGTTKGTVATLIDSRIFSLTPETGTYTATHKEHTRNTRGTTKEQCNNVTRKQCSKKRGTLEEITAFCIKIGLPATDGESTFYKWQGNGWMNKGRPVGDWQATIQSWKAAGYMPSQKTQVSNKPQPTSANGFKLS